MVFFRGECHEILQKFFRGECHQSIKRGVSSDGSVIGLSRGECHLSINRGNFSLNTWYIGVPSESFVLWEGDLTN